MSTVPEQRQWTREDYERSADEYYLSLPLEHFMEATRQGGDRRLGQLVGRIADPSLGSAGRISNPSYRDLFPRPPGE